MNSQYVNLGLLNYGVSVKVTFSGISVKIMLMDSINYQNYCSKLPYKYYGGHATQSPFCIPIPNMGNWYIVVEGCVGIVSCSVTD